MGLNHSPLIVTNGLRQYLDAGNAKSYPGTGTAWNDIADGFNATLATPTYSTLWNGTLLFNGTNDDVLCGDLGTLTAQGTIGVWFNSSSVTNYRGVFCTQLDGLNTGFRIEQVSSGNLNAYLGNGDNVTGPISFGTISAGSWYRVDLAWNTATNTTIGYLNGEQSFSTSNTYWPATIPSLTLGNAYSSAIGYRFFQGYISQLMVYDRVITAQEATINFDAMRTRFGA
jgi:hypothetical protein